MSSLGEIIWCEVRVNFPCPREMGYGAAMRAVAVRGQAIARLEDQVSGTFSEFGLCSVDRHALGAGAPYRLMICFRRRDVRDCAPGVLSVEISVADF